MLNVKYQSILHTYFKSFVGFLNIEYHEDIFVHWANKLLLLNIQVHYIPIKKNIVTNSLFQVIFNNANCFPE